MTPGRAAYEEHLRRLQPTDPGPGWGGRMRTWEELAAEKGAPVCNHWEAIAAAAVRAAKARGLL